MRHYNSSITRGAVGFTKIKVQSLSFFFFFSQIMFSVDIKSIQAIIIVFSILWILVNYLTPKDLSKKQMCLENLIHDIEYDIHYSYYRIDNFRCGYNLTAPKYKPYLQMVLQRELHNKEDRFAHELAGNTRIMYNPANINLHSDYLKGVC